MIKAVFFDLYHTLVRYEPPREEIQAMALKYFGIEVSLEALRRSLVVADEFICQEIAHHQLSKRSEQEKMALWVQYQKVLFKDAGIKADEKLILGSLGKMQQMKRELVPFDDVVPALTELKDRDLILGLISNVESDMTSLLKETGLQSLLQVVVISLDAGCNKPHPEIFREALKQAGIQASEALYVGDQYQVDVIGANNAGMKGILLDRGGYFAEVTDCPRIQSLDQVAEYL